MINLFKKLINYILSIKVTVNIKEDEPIPKPSLSNDIIDGDAIIQNNEEPESILDEIINGDIIVENIEQVAPEPEEEEEENNIEKEDVDDDIIPMNKNGSVTADALFVRSGPSIEYPILGCVLKNDRIEIVGQNKLTKWYKIEYEEGFGFISNKYVLVIDIITNTDNSKKYGDGCEEIDKTIDSYKCCFKFNNAVITQYEGGEVGAYGKLIYDQHCGAHNLPYGTLVYIPLLKGVINQTGLFTVMDTGGHCTDFDIYTKKDIGKINADVYVVSYGKGPIAWSFTDAIEFFLKNGKVERYNTAWSLYNKMKGCTINYWVYKDDDRDIKSKPWYDSNKIQNN